MNPRIPLTPELPEEGFTYAEGLRAGLGEKRLRGGDLVRPFHGIRSAKTSLSLVETCRVLFPQLPEGAFFSSITAAALMDVPLPFRYRMHEAIHVAVISPHRSLEGAGIIGHKIQPMGHDSWELHGIRLSTPSRVWCELGMMLSLPELVAAGDWLISPTNPLVEPHDLADALDRFPDRRGRRRLREAASLLDGRAESPMESQLRVILVRGGIGGLEPNWPIRVRGQNFRIDLAIPAKKIAIEYQGDYHREPEQWRRDMSRASKLESESWYVFHFNADDLRDETELVSRVRRVAASRSNFPVR